MPSYPMPVIGENCVQLVEITDRGEGWMVTGTPCEWRVTTWSTSSPRSSGILCANMHDACQLFRRLCTITERFGMPDSVDGH
jgi:hypothetical protein